MVGNDTVVAFRSKEGIVGPLGEPLRWARRRVVVDGDSGGCGAQRGTPSA